MSDWVGPGSVALIFCALIWLLARVSFDSFDYMDDPEVEQI